MEESIYKSKELSDFTKSCIRCSGKEKQILNLWSESQNVLVFRKKIAEKLDDYCQSYYEAELQKNATIEQQALAAFQNTNAFIAVLNIITEDSNLRWLEIRKRFDNVIKTESDVGSLLVGNENFAIQIHNGHGDGCTRVCVFNSITNDVNVIKRLMNYQTTLEGIFNIYSYDFANRNDVRNIVKTLSGKYEVFTYDGLVALIKH